MYIGLTIRREDGSLVHAKVFGSFDTIQMRLLQPDMRANASAWDDFLSTRRVDKPKFTSGGYVIIDYQKRRIFDMLNDGSLDSIYLRGIHQYLQYTKDADGFFDNFTKYVKNWEVLPMGTSAGELLALVDKLKRCDDPKQMERLLNEVNTFTTFHIWAKLDFRGFECIEVHDVTFRVIHAIILHEFGFEIEEDPDVCELQV